MPGSIYEQYLSGGTGGTGQSRGQGYFGGATNPWLDYSGAQAGTPFARQPVSTTPQNPNIMRNAPAYDPAQDRFLHPNLIGQGPLPQGQPQTGYQVGMPGQSAAQQPMPVGGGARYGQTPLAQVAGVGGNYFGSPATPQTGFYQDQQMRGAMNQQMGGGGQGFYSPPVNPWLDYSGAQAGTPFARQPVSTTPQNPNIMRNAPAYDPTQDRFRNPSLIGKTPR